MARLGRPIRVSLFVIGVGAAVVCDVEVEPAPAGQPAMLQSLLEICLGDLGPDASGDRQKGVDWRNHGPDARGARHVGQGKQR